MRLFVALTPPTEVLEDLAEHVEPRREAGSEIRWTDTDQWHVTLSFMAEAPERALDDLTERLTRTAARHEPFSLALLGGGAFPNPYAARVLWAGIADPDDGLGPLARGIRNACNKAGATPEGAKFHPHLTLGRFRRPTEATKWIRTLDAYESPTWRATSVSLIESHLGEGRGHRPRHELLAEFPLGGSADGVGESARGTR
jgi:2'-5' RNA ligase